MTVDAAGIAWALELGAGKLCYFDTHDPAQAGSVRDPVWGPMQGWGITVDRDENVWVGGAVARYTPDRSNGFARLGNGTWTLIQGATGTGIVADTRSANAYFVWACVAGGTAVLRIPASTLAIPRGDRFEPVAGWPTIAMPCQAVSLDADGNVWGEDADLSTRALVDATGKITPPRVNGMPKNKNLCPAGDSCPSVGGVAYGANFGEGVQGGESVATYSLLIPGCTDGGGAAGPTEWGTLPWDAPVPAGTSLAVHARSGASSAATDPSWTGAAFTATTLPSPVCLQLALTPNVTPRGPAAVADAWLQVEVAFTAQTPNITPLLKSLKVTYRCR